MRISQAGCEVRTACVVATGLSLSAEVRMQVIVQEARDFGLDSSVGPICTGKYTGRTVLRSKKSTAPVSTVLPGLLSLLSQKEAVNGGHVPSKVPL